MPVTRYANTDAGAPACTGQTDSLNALLHACLVTGYGSKAAAGWTRDFYDATTKTAVFRPAAGTRHYLQVQDNGPGAGSFREARIKAFGEMTAYNTGTDPFPQSSTYFVRKATALNSTAHPWRLYANDRGFYLFIDPEDVPGQFLVTTFVPLNAWKSPDAWATYLSASATENTSTYNSTVNIASVVQSYGGSTVGGRLPRGYNDTGPAVAAYPLVNSALTGVTTAGQSGGQGYPYPHPVDGSLMLSPIWIAEGTTIRGTLPGIWCPGHARPLGDGDTFSILDGSTTRNFVAQNILTLGQYFIETSDTWQTV